MRIVVVFAAALLLTACPGDQKKDDVAQSGPSRNSTSVANPQAVPGNSTAMNPVSPPGKEISAQRLPAAATAPIQVQLTEFQIQMPDTLTAGAATFHIVNAGHYNHNFAIEGNGVSQKLANDLTKGDSGDMNVTLPAGTYTVYCPVDKHRGRGMQRTITVR